jgi:DNA-binding CsgD family transcriptional regulator
MLLGAVAYGEGDYARARAAEEESLALFRETGQRSWEAGPTWHLGLIAEAQGRFLEAARHYQESLHGYLEAGDASFFHKALPGLATMAAIGGLPELGARLLGATDAQLERAGSVLYPYDRQAYERAENGSRAALSQQAFAAEFRTGRELTPDDWPELADAIVAAVERATQAPRKRGAGPSGGLTRRERDVLRLMAQDRTDREIADALFIGHRTVNTHVANILRHLDVSSRRGAIRAARERGLLPPEIP